MQNPRHSNLNDCSNSELIAYIEDLESKMSFYHDYSPQLFFVQGKDLSFDYLSPGALKLFGESLVDNIVIEKWIHEEDRANAINSSRLSLRKGEVFNASYRIQNPGTGNVSYVSETTSPRFSESGNLIGFEGFWVDNTKQVVAEKKLSSSSWRENLATLTAGLVHDFSNMMAGIYSLSECYYARLDQEDSMYEGIGQIKKSSLEAQRLIKRIVQLNREKSGYCNYHNLEYLISEQIDLIKVIFPKSTQFEIKLTGKELAVYLDDIAFRQMLINFAINAKDAVGSKGQIGISVRQVFAKDKLFDEDGLVSVPIDRDGVLVSFSDNGEGINTEHLNKIFDPFFTTKEATKGSGFGLYNIKTFIDQSEGHIAVKSKEGEGTTFMVYFPLANLETESETSQETTISRKRCLVYSSRDPSSFDITSCLLDKEWEIITFSEMNALSDYMNNPSCPLDALFAIDLGKDKNIEPLIDYFQDQHPQIKRLIQVVGRNPDEITPSFRNKVDLVIDESTIATELADQLDNALN